MGEYLQILFDEAELVEIREVADLHRMPVADWVRRTLTSMMPNSCSNVRSEIISNW